MKDGLIRFALASSLFCRRRRYGECEGASGRFFFLAVDRNRSAVIEQIVTQFRGGFARGQEQVVRETLSTLRADHLLAASLAPNLDGLIAAMKAADTGVGATPVAPKALGDPTADLVYTPRTPCRLFDTRVSQAGLGPLVPGVTRTYSATTPVAQQGGPGGCAAPPRAPRWP